MIGTLGDLAFTVSSEQVLTFDGLKLNLGADYAEHKVHGFRSLLEHRGMKASSCSFEMTLDDSLGVRPSEQFDYLAELLEGYQAVSFVLDGKPIGHDRWVIESLDTQDMVLDKHGRIRSMKVSVKMREYVEVGTR